MLGVKRAQHCDLRVVDDRWDYAFENARVIDAHWEKARNQNSGFFNGTVFLMTSASLEGAWFHATFVKTEFKNFLYWHHNAFDDDGVRDAFGSCLIRSREGHVVLGVQTAGNVNSGLAYTPGGFIDERDVSADGRIDIVGSVRRELVEETGLAPDDLVISPGFYLTFFGAQVSIGVEFVSMLASDEIVARIHRHIADVPDPELADTLVVTEPLREGAAGIAPFVVPLLNAVLSFPSEKDT